MKTYAVTVTGRKFNKQGVVLVTAKNQAEARKTGKAAAVEAMQQAPGYFPELAVTTTVERVA